MFTTQTTKMVIMTKKVYYQYYCNSTIINITASQATAIIKTIEYTVSVS